MATQLELNNTQLLASFVVLAQCAKVDTSFAVFCYRGLMWLVDDGSFPRPLPQLQDTMKSQIVQVWAIPSKKILPIDIPSDIPTTRVAPAGPETTAKRRCREGVGFSFANVTHLGQAVRQWRDPPET